MGEGSPEVGWRSRRCLQSPTSLSDLGVIFLPLGIPTGCLAAPAEVSSSCAMDEECGAGSAAWSLLGDAPREPIGPGGLGRGQAPGGVSSQPLWPTGTKTSSAGPQERESPKSTFPVGSSPLSPVGPRTRGWGCGQGRGVPTAGSALMGVPSSRGTSWDILPGRRMETPDPAGCLSKAPSYGKRVFWG